MSRIHEALKKAAEERAVQLGSGAEAVVAEILTEPISPVTQQPVSQQPGVIGSTVPTCVTSPKRLDKGLSYEELVKQCAPREWRIDPLNSVFLGSKTGEGGPERFRTLRSRLYKIASTRKLKRVLVTSAVAGEGKTFVTSNLAQAIVQQPELRVLLIDADLRSSRLHLLFGAPSCPGLSDYLRGEVDEYGIIQRGTGDNLFLIAGGNLVSNPSELLLNGKIKQLLNNVTPVFDWIIIDSPPTLPVHDATILAEMVDGVLFVIQAGSTDAEIVERTAAEFQDKNLLGVVLNQVQKSDSYGDRYQSYYGESD